MQRKMPLSMTCGDRQNVRLSISEISPNKGTLSWVKFQATISVTSRFTPGNVNPSLSLLSKWVFSLEVYHRVEN